MKTFKTPAQQELRGEHIENAIAFTLQLLHDADLRGMSAADCVASIVAVMAARNATLTGKALQAVADVIRSKPVTKIITEVAHGPPH